VIIFAVNKIIIQFSMAIRFLPVQQMLNLGLRDKTQNPFNFSSGGTNNDYWLAQSACTINFNHPMGVSGYMGTMAHSGVNNYQFTPAPVVGGLHYDMATGDIKVYNGEQWVSLNNPPEIRRYVIPVGNIEKKERVNIFKRIKNWINGLFTIDLSEITF
jgi:hypothetical protein